MYSLYEICLIYLNKNLNLINFTKLNSVVIHDLRNIIADPNHLPKYEKLRYIKLCGDIDPFLIKYCPNSKYLCYYPLELIKIHFADIFKCGICENICENTGIKYVTIRGNIYYIIDENNYASLVDDFPYLDYRDIFCIIIDDNMKIKSNYDDATSKFEDLKWKYPSGSRKYFNTSLFPNYLIEKLYEFNYVKYEIIINKYCKHY